MNPFAPLMEKSWLPPEPDAAQPGKPPQSPGPDEPSFNPKKVALRFFLGAIGVMFFLILLSAAGRLAMPGTLPMPQINLLWINTLFLILASVAMHFARMSAAQDNIAGVRSGLAYAGYCSAAFLVGQMVAWWQLYQSGDFTLSLPAVGLFYMITGIHAVHILGGLIAYGRTIARVLGGADSAKVRTSVDLCTTYWHFMLAVWLAMFGLVFTGNIAGTILSYCGLV